MSAKHSPAPWRVEIEDRSPFKIRTLDADGDIIASECMPCHSSNDKTLYDAINCVNFPRGRREEYSAINRLAIANATLRAAAPELLEALREMVAYAESPDFEGAPSIAALQKARAAIAKATGEQA